jgi:transcriptional regulator with XRE-family HTH domain
MDLGDPGTASDPLGLFCARLKRLQTQSGINQAALLDAAGLGRSQVSDILKGKVKRRPDWGVTIAIVRACLEHAKAASRLVPPDLSDEADWQRRYFDLEQDLEAGARAKPRREESAGRLSLDYQRQPDAPGMPLRLAPRPVFLAGRERLLAELDTRLAAGVGPRLVALCGLGGVGKTSVALEYAHRHLTEVKVCWQFSAEDPELLAAEFAVFAAQLGVRNVADARDPVATVHGVLAQPGGGWLLIFDNVVKRTSLERFLPPAGDGRVLITTQNQHWPTGQGLNVSVLGPEVASDFLLNRTTDSNRAAALELAVQMGGLPLALEQAAAYMQATGTTLGRYLHLFRDRQADLLARGEAAGHPADVAATLGLALSRLAGEAPAAAGLVRLVAFLAPEAVPLDLLLADEKTPGLFGPEVAAEIGPLLGDPVAFGDAVAALRRYSLVTPAGDALVMVHRLVQAITRDQLSAEMASQWKQAAAALIEAAVPADPEAPGAWPVCTLLLPHARVALNLTSNGMRQVAQSIGYSGNYSAARDLFRLIADSRADENDAYSHEHPDTLEARAAFAYWTGLAGDPAAARDQYAALLPIRQRILGPEHPDTLTTRADLAYWTGATGAAAAARDQYAVLLPIRQRILGPEHPDTLSTLSNIARWTGEAGDPAAARDQYAALLPIRQRILGPEHPDTLTTLSGLARWTKAAAP